MVGASLENDLEVQELGIPVEKAGRAETAALDPRALMLIEECWRHSKAVGAWGAGVAAVAQAGVDGYAGIVLGDGATEVLEQVQQHLARHRVWERFAASLG